jgi:short-subunit dehydrogenase
MLKESGTLVGAQTRNESQDLPAIHFRKPRRQYSLVTGASQGLGRALAEECARLGMNLILVALPDTELPRISKELASRYRVAVVYREMDLLEPDSPKAIYRWIEDQKLRVNMLVNNAGIGCQGSFVDSQPERNQAMINLNITALVQLTHIFLPELRAHDRSYILNVASLAAFYPMPFKPVYAPTKAFVLNFSLALRAELAGTSVRVSALCPGGIMTNEECRRLIAAQGFFGRISCHYPEEVARCAIRHLFQNKSIIVPGLVNKLARFLGGIIPLSVVQLFIRSRFGSAERAKGSACGTSVSLSETNHE